MGDFINHTEPQYQIAICELYNPYFHGSYEMEHDLMPGFKNYLYGSFLCTYSISSDSIYDDMYPSYNSGTRRNGRTRLEIVQLVHLNTGHQLCILKTFWLKIIQRKYKNYYKNLQKRIALAKHPKALLRRQITGVRF